MNKKIIRFKTKPIYKTKFGKAYVGDSLEYLKDIPDEKVNLILTSPPFALTRQKEYGNKGQKDYIEWFLKFASECYRILKKDGSLVIDLGGSYIPGHAIKSIYQYELLVRLCKEYNFNLAQEFFHYNPSRLPTPAEWVTIQRIRVKDSVNVVWWLSKSEKPKSNNRNVLKPYSDSMISLLKNGYKAKLRPSGHDISKKFSNNNGGAIPSNLLALPNTESNSYYMRKCKELQLKPHPARFPKDFSDFFIKFLTDENDLVIDPFAGSNTTGYSAELLSRKWLSFEINNYYCEVSKVRFNIDPKLALDNAQT